MNKNSHTDLLAIGYVLLGLMGIGYVSPPQANAAVEENQDSSSPFPARMRGVNCPINGFDVDVETTIARFATWGVNTLRINFSHDGHARRGVVADPPTEVNPLAPYRRNI